MILVFDTSTSHLAIGLADATGHLLSEFHADASENERGIHDARLAAETAKLISKAGIAPRTINRIGSSLDREALQDFELDFPLLRVLASRRVRRSFLLLSMK